MPPIHPPDLPCPCSTAVFTTLRALDPLLQYFLLTRNLGTHLTQRLHGCPSPRPATAPATHLPLHRAALLAMATGASLHHIFWATTVRPDALTPCSATVAGLGNGLFTSVNSLLFASGCGGAGGAAGGFCTPLAAGGVLYVLGMGLETVAEVQRKCFQAVKGNEARVCGSGVWKVVRHPNYLGDVLWRVGFAVAAGGWKWGGVVGVGALGYYACVATPGIEERCGGKYGEQWRKYVKETPAKLIPGIM